MSEQVGSLVVSLQADIARFDADLKRATTMATGAMGKIQEAATTAARALGAIGAGLGVAALVGVVKNAIDAADALGKLSQRTGITVEDLGGLKYAAELSGVSLEGLAKGVKALSVSAVEAASGNKEMAKVFKLMGVDVKDAAGNVKNMNALLEESADKFASYRDGPEKTALAMKIMSKAGSEMIPLLNMGGEAIRKLREEQARYGGVSTETSEKAQEFNDTLTRLEMMSGAFGKTLSAQLLQPLQAVADWMVRLRERMDAFSGVIEPIVDAFKILASVTVVVGSAIGALVSMLWNVADFLAKGAFGQDDEAWAALKKAFEQPQEIIKEGWATLKELWGKGYRDFKDTQTDIGGGRGSAPNVGGENLKELKETAERIAEINRLLTESRRERGIAWDLTDYAEGLDRIAASVNPLAEQNKKLQESIQLVSRAFQAGWLTWDQGKSLINQLNSQSPETLARIEKEVAAVKAYDDALRELVASLEDYKRAQESAADSSIRDMQGTIEDLETEVRLLGLSNREREREIINIRAKKALESQTDDLGRKVVEDQRRQALALLDQRDALEQNLGFWRQIDDVARDIFTNLAERGTSAFKDIGASIKRWVLDLLYQITVKRWIIGLSASFTGGGAAASGGGAAGGGVGGGDLIGGVAGLFGAGGLDAIGATAALIDVGFSGTMAAGIASVAGAAMAAIPYIGIALMAAQALGAFDRGGPKVGAFAQTSGLNLDPFFEGDGRQLQGVVTGTQTSYRNIVSGFGGRPGDFQFALGYDTDPEGDAPNRISAGASVDGVTVVERLSEDIGRDQARLEEELANTVEDALRGALLASDIPEAVKELLRDFDGTVQELEAYALKLVGVNALLRTTNVGLQQILSGLTLSQLEDFTDLLGGVGPAVQGLTFYMEQFYTETERATIATESLVGDFANLGLTLPATRLEFRQLMEGIDLTTEAGQRLYASLIGNVQAIDAYYDRIETGTEALAEAAEVFRDNATALAYEDYWTEYRRLAEERRQLAEDEARNRAEARAQLRDFLSELLTGDLSPLAPQQQLGIAKDQYLAALQSGTDIQGAASRYLDIARQYNPLDFNSAFVDVVNQVGAAATPSGMAVPGDFKGVTDMLARVRATTEAGAEEVSNTIRESTTMIINTLTGPRTVVFR